jgi:hypothetical protein
MTKQILWGVFFGVLPFCVPHTDLSLYFPRYCEKFIAMAVPHDCTQLCEGCEPSVLGFIPRLTIASFAPLRQESTQPIAW